MSSSLSSFWNQFWSRRNDQMSSTSLVESHEVDLSHFMPPDVTRSHSTETTTTIHDHGSIAPNSPPPKESYVTVRLTKAPNTPEGLRPRLSIQALRQELELDVGKQPRQHCQIKRDFLVEKTVDPSRMLPAAPSRSWSIPSQPSLPLVSANPNGLDDTCTHSPRLQLGKARTAVGSFVAYCEQTSASAARPSSSSLSIHGEGYDGDADGSQSYGHNKFASRPPTLTVMEDEGWDEKKEELSQGDNGIPYYPLEKDPMYLSPTQQKNHITRNIPLSPFSTNISLDASPSSLAKPYSRTIKANQHDTSFSSGTALLSHAVDNSQYDFGHFGDGPQETTKEIHVRIASDQMTHVSGMTQSVGLENDGLAPGMMADKPYDESEENNSSVEWGDDSSLIQQKVQNQRRVREELIESTVERLQDNIELIAEVYKADPAALQTNWFVETPMDQEGILTGFSTQKRMSIIHFLTAMLDEMNVAQPEYFFTSPSQIQQYAQPHNELQMALSFCRRLVQIAVPPAENAIQEGHWSPVQGLRPAMGIVSVESPPNRRRGGDTSVFTLPSASAGTPMTSNVSFSTTIASSQQASKEPSFHKDGLKVRHTIEIVSTLLQKLSLCCHDLVAMNGLQTEKTVRITKEIKRNYIQLISVDHNMLRAVVDSFNLEKPRPALSQIVSADDEDENESNQVSSVDVTHAPTFVIHPPRVVRNYLDKTSRHYSQRSDSSASRDLFSPQTLDMMSDRHVPATVPEEFDDLRRHIGSVDYDDFEEYREGPEVCQRE